MCSSDLDARIGGDESVSAEILDQLVATIRAHYEQPYAQPLLLSTFGQLHPDMLGPIKAAFKSLKAAIQAAGEDRLRFVDTTIGQDAVAPTDLAGDIEKKLTRETSRSQQAEGKSDVEGKRL